MPFTDPMAEGPAIQASSLRALKGGQTMAKTLAMVARLPRERHDDADRADGLLQSDLFLRRREVRDAMRAHAGVDGLIIVDLPPEEDQELRGPAKAAGLDLIRLADTDDRRSGACTTVLDGAHRAFSITSRSRA